jgi:hypothetical protein
MKLKIDSVEDKYIRRNEEWKAWDSTWIYDLGGISGVTDKGMTTKAC